MTPTRRAFWKRMRPTSLRHALEGCKDFALEAHRLSVERIAEQMGLADHWALYKWLQTGRFPMVLIPAYERVCGIDLATRWLASTSGQLLVAMPKGKQASAADLVELNTGFASALQLLGDFYTSGGQADPAPVLEALRGHLEAMAHHHANVAGYRQPELELA